MRSDAIGLAVYFARAGDQLCRSRRLRGQEAPVVPVLPVVLVALVDPVDPVAAVEPLGAD
jgi:hypothetical protein